MSARKATGKRDPRPMYARALRLKYIHPGSVLCFLFLEGTLAVGLLLALAELAPWWIIPVLVLAVAAMVKLNDVIAGAVAGPLSTPVQLVAEREEAESADDDLVRYWSTTDGDREISRRDRADAADRDEPTSQNEAEYDEATEYDEAAEHDEAAVYEAAEHDEAVEYDAAGHDEAARHGVAEHGDEDEDRDVRRRASDAPAALNEAERDATSDVSEPAEEVGAVLPVSSAQADTARHAASEVDAPEADAASEAAEAEAAGREAAGPQAARVEAAGPLAAGAGADQPEADQPEADQPEASQPEVADAEADEPHATEPRTGQLNTGESGTEESETGQPDTRGAAREAASAVDIAPPDGEGRVEVGGERDDLTEVGDEEDEDSGGGPVDTSGTRDTQTTVDPTATEAAPEQAADQPAADEPTHPTWSVRSGAGSNRRRH